MALGTVSVSGYVFPMAKGTARPRARKKAAPKAAPRRYPNRIAELTKARELTYAAVGDELGAHEITIAKLATGKMQLTLDWMIKLGGVFKVEPQEIIAQPIGKGLRRVRVSGAIQAGAWQETHEWEDEDRYDVMVPDTRELRGQHLYAGEIRGESMNLIYPAGSVVIMSTIVADEGSDIAPGRRYHVRLTRSDGASEDTIKTLVTDENGRFWLKPESSDPRFQTWIALEGQGDATIELLGRVRFAVKREG